MEFQKTDVAKIVPAGDALALRTWGGRGTLVVHGPERKSWLNGLLTCDVGELRAGAGTWGLLLDRKGKIQSVLWVLSTEEKLWLAPAAETTTTSFEQLDQRLIMEDAELTETNGFTWLTLHGAGAVGAAQLLTTQWGGQAAALDWIAEECAMLCLPSEKAARVTQECAAGELTVEGKAVVPLSDEQWVGLRLNHSLAEFGADFDTTFRPHEASLERRAVCWSKGCYLGQEVVCMQDMRGKVKNRVAVLEAVPPHAVDEGTGDVPGVGDSVLGSDEQEVGSVTSAGIVDGKLYVMARLPTQALAAEPSQLTIAKAGNERWALHPAPVATSGVSS